MASAFFRMIGWPNSPILPKILTSVSTNELGLIGAELFEHHGGFAVHSAGRHAIFRFGTQGRAPVLAVLLFNNYFSLEIEGNGSDSDFQRSLIGRIVDFADGLNPRQRLRYLGHVHEKVPKRLAGNGNLRALA